MPLVDLHEELAGGLATLKLSDGIVAMLKVVNLVNLENQTVILKQIKELISVLLSLGGGREIAKETGSDKLDVLGGQVKKLDGGHATRRVAKGDKGTLACNGLERCLEGVLANTIVNTVSTMAIGVFKTFSATSSSL